MNNSGHPRYHIADPSWRQTAAGAPRGYIQPTDLRELWIHTGTACNLGCEFCLEGAGPDVRRIEPITLAEAKQYIDMAIELTASSVQRFSFTGGEPLILADIVPILEYALDRRPCLVLTNATEPLESRLNQIALLRDRPHPLHFRVSLDSPHPEEHDRFRGAGRFELSLRMLGELHQLGFPVAVARLATDGEDTAAVNAAYLPHFDCVGLPPDTHIVVFPEFLNPNTTPNTPEITENCMRTYTTEETRSALMCRFSKMIAKKNGRVGVYPCTLVDDDDDYNLSADLRDAMHHRVMLKHHRCFSCFSCGASCSQ